MALLRPPRPDADRGFDVQVIAIGAMVLYLSGLFACVLYTRRLPATSSGPVVLWSLAILISGGTIGFLFGIPKVLQSNRTPAAVAAPVTAAVRVAINGAGDAASRESEVVYEQRVNTNLEEISDWLTKIIVGLGLVNLNNMPAQLLGLARIVAAAMGLPPDSHQSFGLAIVVFFSATGFLSGYLLTRLYIQGALARAETGILAENRRLRHRLTSVETQAQVLAETQSLPAAAAAAGNPIDDRLRQLARRYLSINVADYAQRVAAKNAAAADLYRYVVDHQISRDLLAEEEDEGLIMALATSAHVAPSADDLTRLEKVADKVTRLHVRYRIVLAIEEMFRRRICGRPQRDRAVAILTRYLDRADESLRTAIQTALKTIDASA
ncbi:MAG TPA: hypothetical protein VKZ18_06000 [Polyangia bacterium]|nr:hypothetical protein [Polyangia bacterium]